MEDAPPDEIVEVTTGQWVALAYSREWPRYVVRWSVRQRAGDADFPVAGGQVEARPSSATPSEAIWSELRQQALDAAPVASSGPSDDESERRSLLAKLFRVRR